ncbi:hypothetical protein D5H78_00355 [Vallicoccus soli]|uniref:Heavy-metal-associated domain-containing protein n=1 Tax=Vallicoccus soli TaxID=2339232 RepID=A0A3A3Z3K9_9ACTN|nr:hypothetical protein D5H78_00355 [Vallicoccus soli]
MKVAAYVAALGAVLAAATGVGAAVGPLDEPAPPAHAAGHAAGNATGHATGHAAAEPVRAPAPGGLAVAQDGYALRLAQRALPAGEGVPLAFRLEGPDGRAVTAYDERHERDLHLVAVRRDLTGFQHVHPRLGADGTWSVPLDLTPGAWRVVVDTAPRGYDGSLVLGADLLVPGDHEPEPLPAPATAATADGYEVTLDGGLVPGEPSTLAFTVTRDGRPVTDLQPYLGAYGHLVALRDGDVGYLHVHPEGEPGDGTTEPGPRVAFTATAPSPGDYRLFLDLRHGGTVRTVAFTVRAGEPAGDPAADPADPADPAGAPRTDHPADHPADHDH